MSIITNKPWGSPNAGEGVRVEVRHLQTSFWDDFNVRWGWHCYIVPGLDLATIP